MALGGESIYALQVVTGHFFGTRTLCYTCMNNSSERHLAGGHILPAGMAMGCIFVNLSVLGDRTLSGQHCGPAGALHPAEIPIQVYLSLSHSLIAHGTLVAARLSDGFELEYES